MLGLRVFVCGVLVIVGCAGRTDVQPDRSRAPMTTRGNEPVEPRACGSDLVCPLGFVCAKKSGAFTGDCLRSVDEDGAPVEVRHSVDSYGAGPNSCSKTSDCPSAFRCDGGRCIR